MNNWNYKEHLTETIIKAQSDVGLSNFKIEVCTEQDFVKRDLMTPNTIYVVIKYLTSDITIGAVQQPVQLLILSEQNSLENARLIFNQFAFNNNLKTYEYKEKEESDSITYVKQQYNSPVVLSNFNEAAYGYRSVMYLSATLFVIEDIIDVRNLKVTTDNPSGSPVQEDLKPLGFNINYTMTTNTQQIPDNQIATSVKNNASFSITIRMPMLSESYFLHAIIRIMEGIQAGNSNFKFSFDMGFEQFRNVPMKLISAQFVTAPNSVPSLQLGFIR